MAGGKKTFTKEEDLLLQDFSRNVSTKSSALFYGNAFIVSAIPTWLFWRIHQMDLYHAAVLLVVMTFLNTWLIAFAYKNVKFVLKHKVALKREDAVSREILKKLADDKKMSKKEKDERQIESSSGTGKGTLIVQLPCYSCLEPKLSHQMVVVKVLWKKNEVADYEATTFSIFYNNALFLMFVILASFYVLRSFTPALNYTLSVGLAGGLLALLSTGSQ